MKRKIGFFSAIGGIISSILGVIGFCIACPPVCGGICIAGPLAAIFGISIVGFLYKYNMAFVVLGILFFLFGIFLIIRNKKTCCNDSVCAKTESVVGRSPQKLIVSYLDYIKMFWNWLFLFQKPFSVKPGLYFTGDQYDKKTPLLVTCNFLSTIVLLFRRIKPLNVRLLILDTNGINVWCSSGGGVFSSGNIVDTLNAYNRDLLTDSEEIELIIPKLSLSGVRLAELQNNKIRAIIGPIYAKDIKEYLSQQPYKDRLEDRVRFGIRQRIYTVIPTVVQFSGYALLMGVIVFILDLLFKKGFHWQVIPIAVMISLVYPTLFPWLPGKRFAVKGISLGIIVSILSIYALEIVLFPLAVFYSAFIFGTSIFLALSYTGNSPISNYSKVKKEITHFLPLNVIFYVMALVFYFVDKG